MTSPTQVTWHSAGATLTSETTLMSLSNKIIAISAAIVLFGLGYAMGKSHGLYAALVEAQNVAYADDTVRKDAREVARRIDQLLNP